MHHFNPFIQSERQFQETETEDRVFLFLTSWHRTSHKLPPWLYLLGMYSTPCKECMRLHFLHSAVVSCWIMRAAVGQGQGAVIKTSLSVFPALFSLLVGVLGRPDTWVRIWSVRTNKRETTACKFHKQVMTGIEITERKNKVINLWWDGSSLLQLGAQGKTKKKNKIRFKITNPVCKVPSFIKVWITLTWLNTPASDKRSEIRRATKRLLCSAAQKYSAAVCPCQDLLQPHYSTPTEGGGAFVMTHLRRWQIVVLPLNHLVLAV